MEEMVTDSGVASTDVDAGDVSGVDGGDIDGGAEQAESIPQRSVSFTLENDGPTYEISEEKIRKYYNIPSDHVITDSEWKMGVSAMKQDLRASYVRNKSTQAMKEFEAKEQSMAQLLNLLQDPNSAVEILGQLGLDVKSMAENYLLDLIEKEQMSPKERELIERERKIQEKEALENHRKEQERLAYEQAQMEEVAKVLNPQIINAIESYKLPKNEHTVKRLAYYMVEAGKRGIDVTASDVAPYVKDEYDQINKASLAGYDPETLMELLGEERLKAIRAKDLQKIKTPMPKQTQSSQAPRKPKPASPDVGWKEIVKMRARG